VDGRTGLLSTARAARTVHPASPGAAVNGMDLISAAPAHVAASERRGLAGARSLLGGRATVTALNSDRKAAQAGAATPCPGPCVYLEVDVTDRIASPTATRQHPSWCIPTHCAADEPHSPLHGAAPSEFSTDDAHIELNVLGDERDVWIRLAVESRRLTTGPGSNEPLYASVLLVAGEAVELRDRLTVALTLGGVA